VKEDLIAIILLTIPVLSLGVLTIFFQDKVKKFNTYFLHFSGAFLLSVLALHIFPEVYASAHSGGDSLSIKTLGLFVIIGFFIQVFLEFLSQGIEHGHIHTHGKQAFPIGVVVSLCIHAFIEGIPIELVIHPDGAEHVVSAIGHAHHHHHTGSSDSLLWGVLVHKVPVGVTLAMLLIANNVSKTLTFISLFIFASMAPLGLLLMHYMGHGSSLDIGNALELSMAVVMGMLLHIASTILFEADDGHRFNLKKVGIMAAGAAFAYFTL